MHVTNLPSEANYKLIRLGTQADLDHIPIIPIHYIRKNPNDIDFINVVYDRY